MSEVVILFDRIKGLLWLVTILALIEISFVVSFRKRTTMQLMATGKELPQRVAQRTNHLWQSPDTSDITQSDAGQLIRYGSDLIEHTAWYLGPQGKVAKASNGMNCQNCHLNAGTKPFAANYSAVASTYPKFRQRSGRVESLEKRVNDCFERSLNGAPLAHDSKEMKAIIAYFKWLGKNVSKGTTPPGAGLVELPMLERNADTLLGKKNYLAYCSSCHGHNGEGTKAENGIEWKYPPLWGVHSYNTGAGLYRVSMFARFIKANMPNGISFENAILSNEEAWDIAAFVNSMPRPHKDFSGDWPDIAHKPMDHPFGPYDDDFSEKIHKYGPYVQILAAKKK